MSTLLDLFPQPKPLDMAGGRWLVSQFRLRDLAKMEAWVAAQLPDPLQSIFDLPPGSPERRAALRAAFDLTLRGLPGIDSHAASVLIASPEGQAYCLWLSLSRSHPDFTLMAATSLVGATDEGEWAAFERVAWAIDPHDIVNSEIDAECGVSLPPRDERPGGVTWTEAWLSTRMPVERFGDLTLSQWRGIVAGGKPKERGVEIPGGWSDDRYAAEYGDPRAAFFAEGEGATSGPPEGP